MDGARAEEVDSEEAVFCETDDEGSEAQVEATAPGEAGTGRDAQEAGLCEARMTDVAEAIPEGLKECWREEDKCLGSMSKKRPREEDDTQALLAASQRARKCQQGLGTVPIGCRQAGGAAGNMLLQQQYVPPLRDGSGTLPVRCQQGGGGGGAGRELDLQRGCTDAEEGVEHTRGRGMESVVEQERQRASLKQLEARLVQLLAAAKPKHRIYGSQLQRLYKQTFGQEICPQVRTRNSKP